MAEGPIAALQGVRQATLAWPAATGLASLALAAIGHVVPQAPEAGRPGLFLLFGVAAVAGGLAVWTAGLRSLPGDQRTRAWLSTTALFLAVATALQSSVPASELYLLVGLPSAYCVAFVRWARGRDLGAGVVEWAYLLGGCALATACVAVGGPRGAAVAMVGGLGALGWGWWQSSRRGLDGILADGVRLAAIPLAVRSGLAIWGSLVGPVVWPAVQVQSLCTGVILAIAVLLDHRRALQVVALRSSRTATLELELHERTVQLARAQQQALDAGRAAAERRILLERAVETLSVGLTVVGPNGEILYSNPADAALHGWSQAELFGQPASILGAAFERRDQPPELGPWVREAANVRRDGSTFEVRLTSNRVFGADGSILGTVTTCEDLTLERARDAALQRRDQILHALSEAAQDVLLARDWSQGLQHLLARLTNALGLRRARLVEVPALFRSGPLDFFVEHLHKDVRAQVFDLEQLRTADDPIGLGEARGVAVPVLVADEVRYALVLETREEERAWPTTDLWAARAAARLIQGGAERHEAQLALLESEGRYRRAVEQSSEMIQSVALDGSLVLVNQAWQERLGYSGSDVEGLSIWDIVEAAEHEHCRDFLAEMLSGSAAHSATITTTFCTRAGERFAVEGMVSPQTVGGVVVSTLGYFRDISQRVALDQLKDDLLSTVSHELRTPLTSILGSVDLLRSGRIAVASDRGLELLEVAHRNGLRLLKLVNDLLELQRARAGKLRYFLADTDVGELLVGIARDIAPAAEQRGVHLRVEPPDAPERIVTDPERVSQIALNFLANAIRVSRPGDFVALSARFDGAELVILVADRGPGIAAALHDRVFQRFEQLPQSRGGGFGLGLPIAAELARGLGGRVGLDSRPGEGSTFFVRLPREVGRSVADETDGALVGSGGGSGSHTRVTGSGAWPKPSA